MFVWVCVTVREWEWASEHCCCMGLLFTDKPAPSCQISLLWSLWESWLNESGRDFTNLQSCHWYIVVSGPLSPDFDLHSSWYQTPTALQADKTRRPTEENSALGRSTSQQHEGWEEWEIFCLYISTSELELWEDIDFFFFFSFCFLSFLAGKI